jgi:hypothetical protein
VSVVDTSMFADGVGLEPFPVIPGIGPSSNPGLKQWAGRTVEKLRAAVAGGLRFLPRLDNYTEETSEIRAAYRLMLREPVLKSAHKTKVEAVAQLDWQVLPADKKDPRAVDIAECLRHCLKLVSGRTVRIARGVLGGALLDGFSVVEKKWTQIRRGKWAGKWCWEMLKSKDTRNLTLSTDQFRNITAVRPLAFGIGQEFRPQDFLIYTYGGLFESALGTSDHRAAYGSFWFKDTVKRLWGLHLDKYVSPVLKGTYSDYVQKVALEEAMEQARSDTWLTIPAGATVDALQLATRGEAEFEAACDYQDRQMLIATAGAYLQTLEGKITDGRGDTSIHRDSATLFQWGLAADLQCVVNEQLVPEWVEVNYAGADCPEVVLGSVSDGDLKASLDIDKGLQELGFKHSRESIAEYYGREEATDPSDVLAPGGGGDAPSAPMRERFRRFLEERGIDPRPFDRLCDEGPNKGKPGPCPAGRTGDEDAGGSGGTGEVNPKLPSATRPKLSEKQISEVQQYLAEDTPYYDVNAHLRSGGQLYDDTLQKAIEKAEPMPSPVTVHRGFEASDVDALHEELKSGSFTDAGFMSTSTDPGGAFSGNVKLTIKARHGLDASHYGSNSGEMLLPAGSEFRVISVTRTGDRIKAELEQVIRDKDGKALNTEADFERFCNEGANKGKPGPCPTGRKKAAPAGKGKAKGKGADDAAAGPARAASVESTARFDAATAGRVADAFDFAQSRVSEGPGDKGGMGSAYLPELHARLEKAAGQKVSPAEFRGLVEHLHAAGAVNIQQINEVRAIPEKDHDLILNRNDRAHALMIIKDPGKLRAELQKYGRGEVSLPATKGLNAGAGSPKAAPAAPAPAPVPAPPAPKPAPPAAPPPAPAPKPPKAAPAPKAAKPAAVAVKAAADKVAKINAKVDAAKANLATLKGQLKAAKADLAAVKGGAKAAATGKAAPPDPAAVTADAGRLSTLAGGKVSDADATAALAPLAKQPLAHVVAVAKAAGVVKPGRSKKSALAALHGTLTANRRAEESIQV